MSDYDRDEPGKSQPNPRKEQGDGQGPNPMPPPGGRFIWVLFFFLLMFGVIAFISQTKKNKLQTLKLSEFYNRLDNVKTARISRSAITGEYRKQSEAKTEYIVDILDMQGDEVEEAVRKYNDGKEEALQVSYKMERANEFIQFILIQLLPILLILFVLWFLLARQFRGGGGAGGVLSFGKARAKLHTREQSDVKFDDVAGVDEAKEEVQELVEFLKNPGKFKRLGGRIPRGVLLMGPPGCGKTLLARAIAGEAAVPFFSISGSDFIEMFVGVGASRVRDLFRQAKENSPCIIFLDEIDAVGRRRSVDLHGGAAESAQTLNAILVEMDGFGTNDSIIVIAATNRPDVLDPALSRPGRFDRQVDVELADIRGREAILKVHARKYKLAADIDLKVLARGTPGFSGADLEAVLNEAALHATRRGGKSIIMQDCEEARDKVRWGRQKRSRVMTDDLKKTTAFHEAGHALAAKLFKDATPLHKVSIIPQGRALGMTMSLPEEDRYNVTRNELLDEMCVLLAGRVTEEMFFDDIDSGAVSDLSRVTDIARNMVCRWGMSKKLGLVYHDYDDPLYAEHEVSRKRGVSEATAVLIDEEIAAIISNAYERITKRLQEHRAVLERLANELLKYEVLYAADVDLIIEGKELVRPVTNGDEVADEEADASDETKVDSDSDADIASTKKTPDSLENPSDDEDLVV